MAALGGYVYLLRRGELPESLKNVVSKASEFGGMCLSPILTKMIHNPKLTASLIAASGVYGVELAEEVKFWDNKYGVLTKNVNGSALRKNCQQIKNMFDFIISLPWRWVKIISGDDINYIFNAKKSKLTYYIFFLLLNPLTIFLSKFDITRKLAQKFEVECPRNFFVYPHLIPISALSISIYLLLKNANNQ